MKFLTSLQLENHQSNNDTILESHTLTLSLPNCVGLILRLNKICMVKVLGVWCMVRLKGDFLTIYAYRQVEHL
jgi:hypothetical protein